MSRKKSFKVTRTVLERLSILTTLVLLMLSVLCVGAILYIETSFSKEVDPSLFDVEAVPRSPHFFAYRFSDRASRIGTLEALSEDFYAQKRTEYVSLKDIPQAMIDAFVAIEDKRFFAHNGIDAKRTVAAGINYLLGFSDTFGASTVTQQLVKNVTGNDEISLKRKLQEILLARDLEKRLDKNQILELYLNVIHFSDNCNGIAAASAHYFSKDVKDLTVAECAAIAAITNNPTFYNPIRQPKNNLYRRNLILREMMREGMLSEQEYREISASDLNLCVDSTSCTDGINSWYADMVIEDVIEDLMAEYGWSRFYAMQTLYTKGLRIDVAMDAELQRSVEEYYRTAVRLPQSDGESAQSAVILIDNRTGDVLAVAGAVGRKKGNRLQSFATQAKRPPGSTIKPISVYAPALEEGVITWGSVFDDVPTDFDLEGHSMWPQNATRIYRGLTDVSYAVAHSTNTVAIRALRLLGEDKAFRYAKERFHLGLLEKGSRNDRGDAALGLGQLQEGVTLRELTAAYTVFADGGRYHPWRSYYRVLTEDGTILLSSPDLAERVISEENAAIMTKLLQGVVRNGTSGKISLQSVVECAGKTGTSSNDFDRWFIGYTPDILCGVWCGYPYPQALGERHLCTSIWNAVMYRATEMRAKRMRFSVPDNVIRAEYCCDSGMLPCDSCRSDPRGERTKVGWFVLGSEPQLECTVHVWCKHDTENGGILHTSDSCCSEEYVSLIRVERHFPKEVTVSDAQYVWRGDPVSLPINPNGNEAYFTPSLKDFCGKTDTSLPYNRSSQTLPSPPEEEKDPLDFLPLPWRYWKSRKTA